MKNFEINKPKKQEILNYFKKMKDNFEEEISFDCKIAYNENDYIEFIEDIYNNSKDVRIKELGEEFGTIMANHLDIKSSNVLTYCEIHSDFSEYIDKALKNIRITNYAELEELLSKRTIVEYFKEQFNKNRDNIMPYLYTLCLIEHVKGLSDEELFNNSVTVPETEDIMKHLQFAGSVNDIKLSADYLITLIPF